MYSSILKKTKETKMKVSTLNPQMTRRQFLNFSTNSLLTTAMAYLTLKLSSCEKPGGKEPDDPGNGNGGNGNGGNGNGNGEKPPVNRACNLRKK